MLEIVNALGRPKNFQNNLWQYRDLHWAYDLNEVKWLCNTDNTGGFRLTWTHAKHSLSADEMDRPEFQRNCIEAQWSSKELHRAIKHNGRLG